MLTIEQVRDINEIMEYMQSKHNWFRAEYSEAQAKGNEEIQRVAKEMICGCDGFIEGMRFVIRTLDYAPIFFRNETNTNFVLPLK